MNKVKAFFANPWIILGVYLGLAVLLTFTNISKKQTKIFSGTQHYTHYNNYVIFKQAWFHLREGKDLYLLYPGKQWDLYKYSPTFAMAMSLLAWMPDWSGLLLWNLLNVVLLYAGLRYFIKGPPHTVFMLWFVLNELFTSTLNSQSNALIAGLLLAGFTAFEKRKVQWAALFIVSTFFIKIFGILAAAMFLFYPDKAKFIGWSIVWTAILGLIPLGVTPPETLVAQYQNWLRLLSEDHSGSYGYSFMGVLNSWFGIRNGKDILVLAGLMVSFLPLLFYRRFGELSFRLHWFSALLIWLVIFNHKAESPTFIIAFTGIAVWIFSSPVSKIHVFLAVLAFVFTSLAPTDLFPAYIRHHFFEPYAIKAVPCIVIWLYLMFGLYRQGLTSNRATLRPSQDQVTR